MKKIRLSTYSFGIWRHRHRQLILTCR